MTMPSERTAAVLNTREFLLELLDPKKTPRVPLEIRKRASMLLKHYPTGFYFDEMFAKNCHKNIFGELNK